MYLRKKRSGSTGICGRAGGDDLWGGSGGGLCTAASAGGSYPSPVSGRRGFGYRTGICDGKTDGVFVSHELVGLQQ